MYETPKLQEEEGGAGENLSAGLNSMFDYLHQQPFGDLLVIIFILFQPQSKAEQEAASAGIHALTTEERLLEASRRRSTLALEQQGLLAEKAAERKARAAEAALALQYQQPETPESRYLRAASWLRVLTVVSRVGYLMDMIEEARAVKWQDVDA